MNLYKSMMRSIQFRLTAASFFIGSLMIVTACRRPGPTDAKSSDVQPKPKEFSLTGQVFVTLKDRETVKLSLTDIYLFDLDQAKALGIDIQATRRKRLDEMAEQKTAFQEQIASLQAQISPLKKKYDEADKQLEPLYAAIIKVSLDKHQAKQNNDDNAIKLCDEKTAKLQETIDQLHAVTWKTQPEYEKLAQKIPGLESSIVEIDKKLPSARSNADYVDVKQFKPIAKTTTDADGRYVLHLPGEAAYAVAAYTERESAGVIEKYAWLVKVEPHQTDLMLNNNNMVDTDDPHSMIPK